MLDERYSFHGMALEVTALADHLSARMRLFRSRTDSTVRCTMYFKRSTPAQSRYKRFSPGGRPRLTRATSESAEARISKIESRLSEFNFSAGKRNVA